MKKRGWAVIALGAFVATRSLLGEGSWWIIGLLFVIAGVAIVFVDDALS